MGIGFMVVALMALLAFLMLNTKVVDLGEEPDAILGAGAKLGYRTVGASSAYTYVAQVVDIKPGDKNVSKVKVSNHDSPKMRQQYIAGWIDVGDATAELNYEKARAGELDELIEARTNQEWIIEFPDGEDITFIGFLTRLGHQLPLEDRIVSNVEIATVTGTAVYSNGYQPS